MTPVLQTLRTASVRDVVSAVVGWLLVAGIFTLGVML